MERLIEAIAKAKHVGCLTGNGQPTSLDDYAVARYDDLAEFANVISAAVDSFRK